MSGEREQPAGPEVWVGRCYTKARRHPTVVGRWLARDFAMAGPLAGAELGDGRGPLCGLQTAGGGVRPVLTDWQLAPARQASASAAFIGELGSGKSVGMKAAVFNVLAAGRRRKAPGSRGRAVIVDRTRADAAAGSAGGAR